MNKNMGVKQKKWLISSYLHTCISFQAEFPVNNCLSHGKHSIMFVE